MNSTRGQTTIDFAIGVGVFLAVVLFVFAFIPGILSPFDISGEEEPALSNQISDSLTKDVLGSPSEPHVLDRYCTVEYFNDSRSSPPPGCAYDSMSINEEFDLDQTRVNITIVGDLDGDGTRTPLCWENEPSPVDVPGNWGLKEAGTCGTPSTTLTKGEDPGTSSDSTITARRVVLLNDQSVTMEVVVW